MGSVVTTNEAGLLNRRRNLLCTAHDIQCSDRIFCNPTQRSYRVQISFDRFSCDWLDARCLRTGAALECDTFVIRNEAHKDGYACRIERKTRQATVVIFIGEV